MRPRLPDILLGALALVLLSGTVGLARNHMAAKPLPLLVAFQRELPANVTSIPVEIARRWHEGSEALFVDARELAAFQEGHIPGAIHLDAEEAEALGPTSRAWQSVLFSLRMSPRVIVYCDGPECGASERLAKRLTESGLMNISVLPDGLPGWEAAGYPVTREAP